MHLSNEYYGHRQILAVAAGAPAASAIFGVVQHGFGMEPVYGSQHRLFRRLPIFVWDTTSLSLAKEAGAREVTAIGAPFLYLQRLAPAPSRPDPERRDTVVFPSHGLVDGLVESTLPRFVKELREREDPAASIVALHSVEYENREIRDLYEDAGFRVTTLWRSADSLYDPYLLVRQGELLSTARRVVANAVNTALWYGAWLGAVPCVYGPEPDYGGLPYVDRQTEQRTYPYLWEETPDFDPAAGLAAASEVLGEPWMRDPDELRALLGFDSAWKQWTSRTTVSAARWRLLRRARARSGSSDS